jgi:signal transduction histidine kinase/CheY-like chemotaxis protein
VSSAETREEHFLVLAPTGRDGALTCQLLARAGLTCSLCRDLDELCRRFETDGGAALMVAEEVFVGRAMAQLREALAKQSSWSDIPVLIFTGTPAGVGKRPSTTQLLSTLGNVTLLDRPLRPVTMLSAARTALRARRRQYEARAELYAQQRAVRERDQFLAMLGHELRNPLSAITMALNLDQESGRSKYRDIIGRQVGHLTRLVDDLLDVSRVTSGKIVLRREDVELVELTRRCVAALAPTIAQGTVIEHVARPGASVWVNADAVRIEQVISNLITNAIKYTAAGGRIEVSAEQQGEHALISVRDTGVGLAPEMIDRVFDLFTQVEGSLDRAKGGMGIGLTLVRSLVGLHGGTVKAASAGLGHGAVFTVQLPSIPAPTRFEERPTGERNVELPRKDQSGPVAHVRQDVLIVEDNEDSRELLATILTKRGHRVYTAEDGPSGVEAALAQRPRVLLVDIGLPGLDGYGVARKVRQSLGASVFLVAITGYGQPDDRKRASEAGFDLHLTKPVDVNVIDRLLERGDLLMRA